MGEYLDSLVADTPLPNTEMVISLNEILGNMANLYYSDSVDSL